MAKLPAFHGRSQANHAPEDAIHDLSIIEARGGGDAEDREVGLGQRIHGQVDARPAGLGCGRSAQGEGEPLLQARREHVITARISLGRPPGCSERPVQRPILSRSQARPSLEDNSQVLRMLEAGQAGQLRNGQARVDQHFLHAIQARPHDLLVRRPAQGLVEPAVEGARDSGNRRQTVWALMSSQACSRMNCSAVAITASSVTVVSVERRVTTPNGGRGWGGGGSGPPFSG